MCNSQNNIELFIILHVILDFKGHLRLEYYSGFCMWETFAKWNHTADLILETLVTDQKNAFPLPRSQNSMTHRVKQTDVCSAVKDPTPAEDLAALPEGFLLPHQRRFLPEYPTFSSPSQCILCAAPVHPAWFTAVTSPPWNPRDPFPVGC